MKSRIASFLEATKFAVLACICSVGPLAAFEASLIANSAEPDLKRELSNSSLVLAARRDGVQDAQDILAAAQADYGRMVGALYENGYFSPVVSILVDGREAAQIPPLARLDGVSVVKLIVTPGRPFRFRAAEIGPLAPGTTIPEGFRRGARASTAVVRETAKVAVEGWRNVGHAVAGVDRQEVVADHNTARLDVRMGIAPGPKARFGNVNISGKTAVRTERIKSIAGIPKGDVFDPNVLDRSAARLRRAGAFSSVSLREAEALGVGDTIDIDLAVVDAKPRRFGFGAELQSAEGLTLSGFWMHRNLWGGAERLRVEGEASGLGGETAGYDYRLRTSLTRPSTFNTDTDLFLLGEIEQLDEPLYSSRQATLEARLNHYFSETLSADAGVSFRFADVQDDLGSREFSHVGLPLSVTWDRRDDTLNPTGGTFLNTEAFPFWGIDESADGARAYLDARGYRSLGSERGVVLAGRLQLGSVIGSSLEQTPPDLLFLSGGSGTVRGHTYQSLSIPSGSTSTGGRSFIGFSGEARVNVTEKLEAVAFYDTGYIGANSWIDDTGGWHSGAGLGVRYKTGIGPVRFDLAAPVSGADASGVQFYIGIGQAF